MKYSDDLKINDILDKFADLEEDLSKIPDTLDTLPVGTDMFLTLKCAAAYYVGAFVGIVRYIDERELR